MHQIDDLNLDPKEKQALLDSLDLVDPEELKQALALPSRYCSHCSTRINPIRLFFCPDTTICTEHAQAGLGQPPPVKAMMIYDNKTGGTICFMPEKVFNESKRLTDRKGNMSILRKVSPSKA